MGISMIWGRCCNILIHTNGLIARKDTAYCIGCYVAVEGQNVTRREQHVGRAWYCVAAVIIINSVLTSRQTSAPSYTACVGVFP